MLGSSPRLRGAPWRFARGCPRSGIIPALAGSTIPACIADPSSWDHPRACGEHAHVVVCLHECAGSSPRLRGARHAAHHRRGTPGIIPALAGSTGNSREIPDGKEDHPRACGEHHSLLTQTLGLPGSSPRLRGALGWSFGFKDRDGIIPALAGSTESPLVSSSCEGDHPRACGEHTTKCQ